LSLFADYWTEKGHLIVETERGFMSAICFGETCYVDNFYVRPEHRGTGSALQITLQTIERAKALGCKRFCAEIYKADPLYEYNLKLDKHFGMEVHADTPYKTVLSKEI